VEVPYDSVQREKEIVVVKPERILCEIQIRSKLQDAWGDITHEFHYKAKARGVEDKNLEAFLADVSDRLYQEDRTLMKFRDTYQRLSDAKTKEGRRVGFQAKI
jgi:putative GTP pyrophosphokinase